MNTPDRKPPFYILKPDHGTPATDLIAAHREARERVEQGRPPSHPKAASAPTFTDYQQQIFSPSRG